MNADTSNLSDRSELRRQAEELQKKRGLIPDFPKSTAEWQRVLHELSVHQIELEMQNEQLQQSYDDIQKEQRRYADLYDFAPVGYLTLTADSTITEVNLTAARILSIDRSRLNGARFGTLIVPEDRLVFNSMMKRTFLNGGHEHCEVMIVKSVNEKPGLQQRTFRLDGIIGENLLECHITLTDVKHV